MHPYKFIEIDNLEQIQKEVLSIVPKNVHHDLFYVNDTIKNLYEFNSIRDMLEKFYLLECVSQGDIAFNIMLPNSSLPIHKDYGWFTYTLNIPITECNDSYLHFFTTQKEPIHFTDIKRPSSNFTYYNKEHCTLIDSVKTTQPYIFNSQIPHSVLNKSNKPRIMLLIRINNKANEHFENVFNWRDLRDSNS